MGGRGRRPGAMIERLTLGGEGRKEGGKEWAGGRAADNEQEPRAFLISTSSLDHLLPLHCRFSVRILVRHVPARTLAYSLNPDISHLLRTAYFSNTIMTRSVGTVGQRAGEN